MFMVEVPVVKLVRTGRRNKEAKECLKSVFVFEIQGLQPAEHAVSFKRE
jgi:hypothetical protein